MNKVDSYLGKITKYLSQIEPILKLKNKYNYCRLKILKLAPFLFEPPHPNLEFPLSHEFSFL